MIQSLYIFARNSGLTLPQKKQTSSGAVYELAYFRDTTNLPMNIIRCRMI